MFVAEIMDRHVKPIKPTNKARLAADLMDLKEVGALPVIDHDRIVGLVTERDIAIRSEAAGRDPEFCTVGEVMSPSDAQCFEDEDVTEAAEKMKTARVSCLPVVSRRGERLVGIVSISDIAKQYNKTLAGEIIASI